MHTARRFMSRIMEILVMLTLIFSSFSVSADDAKNELREPYVQRESMQTFIEELVENRGFDRAWLESILLEAEYKQNIIDLMNRTAEGTWTWTRYRSNFLDEERISSGVKFWRENADAIRKASAIYGVPEEIIVSIIGVETRYGAVMGRTRILDALVTLGFDYPRREKFFKKELTQFLLMLREEGLDPFGIRGSYAGAMGFGQFMPSSYRAYAVDFDGDGVRDLLNNKTDAIGSVAAYISRHGWDEGGLVAVPVAVDDVDLAELKLNKRRPHTVVSSYLDSGVSIKEFAEESAADPATQSVDKTLKSTLISLDIDAEEQKEYWLGFNNFYVITRYNTSRMYAMAVYQLSQAIHDRKVMDGTR